MTTTRFTFLAALVACTPAWAINKCVTPGGDVVFTDFECPIGTSKTGRVEYNAPPASGLRQGEIDALRRIEAREARQHSEKMYERERSARYEISYSDQLRIRELEMEKGALSDSLNRGSKTYGQTSAIRSQIRGIDRQIEQIRAPKW